MKPSEETPAGSRFQRKVVSNFLFDSVVSEKPWVAIFHRTVEVIGCHSLPFSTQKNAVNKCSVSNAAGHLEEDTTLSRWQDFKLYLIGKPYDIFVDGTSTTVYPFSWVLKETTKSLRGRETDWKWFSPNKILDGEIDSNTVAPPSQSIWRVWLRGGGLFSDPHMDDESEQAALLLHKCLAAMKQDYESGARQIATITLLHLHDVLAEIVTTDNEEILWRRTRMIAWHLIHNGRPSMDAAIGKCLLSCLWRLWFLQNSRTKMLEAITACVHERKAFSRRIGKSFAVFIQRHFQNRFQSTGEPITIKILTLSSSVIKSALLAALKECNVVFDVRILESRPLCEGAQMASMIVKQAGDLEAKRLKITIATDASVALMAKGVDLVLLGADRISQDGDVSNKTGSYPAVLCAQAVGNMSSVSPKIVVVSGIEKVAKPGTMEEHDEEDNGPSQIWRIWELAGCKKDAQLLSKNHRVDFKNVAFEWVPANCVDFYINEDGEMTREQIAEQSLFMEKLNDDVFGDL